MSSVTYTYGANAAFIEELYERFRANPESVSASWREFFHDYEPQFEEDLEADNAPTPQPRNLDTPQPAAPKPTLVAPPTPPGPGLPPGATPLRGAAGKIAANMETSLSIPTATSVRNIPVKVLEENRRIINNHLTLTGQPKASFTHIIAWAIVKALKEQPRMNAAFAMNDGTPTRIDRDDVNLGLAIDTERKDGTRSLLVPNIKRAQAMDFAQLFPPACSSSRTRTIPSCCQGSSPRASSCAAQRRHRFRPASPSFTARSRSRS